METIADIVAEMRAKTAKSKDEAWYDKEKWAELCSRIEAAWEREAKAIATENAVLPAVCITKPVGNAAKMRGVLEELIANIEMRSSTFGLNVMVDTKTFLNAKAALAEPLRNCDIGTAEEQVKRFRSYCDSKVCKRRECASCGYEELFHHKCALKWAQMPYEEGK